MQPHYYEAFQQQQGPNMPNMQMQMQPGVEPEKPEAATVKKGLHQKTFDGLYSTLSYSFLTWVCLGLLLGYIYMQSKGKAPFAASGDTLNMVKAAMVMNAVLVVVFYLAVTHYRPMDTTPEACMSDDKKASATKFIGLLTEVAINVLPLILTGFLGYHCLLGLHNIATVAFIPAVVFLVYHSVLPVDKIYLKAPDVRLDKTGVRTKGTIMSIVPPTLAVYSSIVGLYYLLHK